MSYAIKQIAAFFYCKRPTILVFIDIRLLLHMLFLCLIKQLIDRATLKTEIVTRILLKPM